MKKLISIIMIVLVGLSIIPKTLVNEKHVVLESTTNVYTKEEVDSLLSAIRTNITNNTNELTNIKSELTALQNSLKDYALKTSLNTTNSNIDGLNTVVTDHTSRIEALENSVSNARIERVSTNLDSTKEYIELPINGVPKAFFLMVYNSTSMPSYYHTFYYNFEENVFYYDEIVFNSSIQVDDNTIKIDVTTSLGGAWHSRGIIIY